MSYRLFKHSLWGLFGTVTVLLIITSSASAQEAEKSSLWLNAGGFSWHFEERAQFNEVNPALGFEYHLGSEWMMVSGRYKNSVNRKTSYFGAAYTPLSWNHLRFGVLLGVADGYPKLNQGRWFGMLTPVVIYENGRFGANLIIIPTISESVKGALAVQFKFRLAEF
ncbi:MAG: hypothetical protein ACK5VU_07790 [Burkholderiales bacterium]|jgi:hypothetical protein